MKKKKDLTTDLTSGQPFRLLIMFTLPILLGGIFQQLYSIADTLIVGRTLGSDALGAVGMTGGITFLMQGLAIGLSSGFAVLTAQKFGAKDEEMVKRSIALSIEFCVFVAVVMTVVSVLCINPVLRLLNFSEEPLAANPDSSMFSLGRNYLFVICCGVGATIFYNLFAQILRALGDSKTPLYFLILTTFLNVGLDFLFILTFKLGVFGAGLATVIAQVVSAVFSLVYALAKYPMFRTKRTHWRVDWRYLWQHIRIGLPMAFQFSVTAIGVIIIQGVLLELDQESGNIASSFTAASKVEQLITQMMVSVGIATSTFVAQNYGAGKMDRVKSGVWYSIAIEALLSVVAFFVTFFAGEYIVKLFIDVEKESAETIAQITANAKLYFTVISPCYILLGLVFVFRNALQGVGRSLGTLFAGIAELGMRWAAAVVLAGAFGFVGVCIGNPLAWLGADVVQIPIFIFSMRAVYRKMNNAHRGAEDAVEAGESAQTIPTETMECASAEASEPATGSSAPTDESRPV